MLIISKEGKQRYNDMLRTLEVQARADFITQQRTDGVQTTDPLNVAAQEHVKRVIEGLNEALNDLNMYGDDPRRVRVYIQFDRNDYTMHGLSYWFYRGDEVDEAGIPTNYDKWSHGFTGALVYHRSDNTWSVHT